MENDLRGFIKLIQENDYGYANYEKPNKVTRFLLLLIKKMIEDEKIYLIKYYHNGDNSDTCFEHISPQKTIILRDYFLFVTKEFKEVKVEMKDIFVAICDADLSASAIKFMDSNENEVLFFYSNHETPDDKYINDVLKEMHILNL